MRPRSAIMAVWALLLLFEVALAGDKGSASSERYQIKHWTTDQGLPQNTILSLAQTRDGCLWIGAPGGLARFDGVRFVVYDHSNTTNMESEIIQGLAEDSEGALWIGTANGLMVYRNRQFEQFVSPQLAGRKVWRLIPSRTGGVWMQAGGSVGHLKADRFTVGADLKLGRDDHVRSLFETEDGALLVVTASGVKRVSTKGQLDDCRMPTGTNIIGVSGAISGAWPSDQKGRFWLSTGEGLWCHDDQNWQLMQEQSCNAQVNHTLYEDRSGSLWVHRGEAGLWRCSGAVAEAIHLGDARAERSVICMLQDREGQMWIGSDRGLSQLRPTFIRTFSSGDGLAGDDCWSLCAGPDDSIWVQTDTGVSRIQKERVEAIQNPPNVLPVRTMLVDSQNTVWLGTRGQGLWAWQPGISTNRFWKSSEGTWTIDALYLDRERRVWIGREKKLMCFDEKCSPVDLVNWPKVTGAIRAIYQTRDGGMWFGTWDGGAVRWDIKSSTVLNYTTSNGLADNRVFAFHEDADGALWMATHNGLTRLKAGALFT